MLRALVKPTAGRSVTAAAQNVPIGHSKMTGREAVHADHCGG